MRALMHANPVLDAEHLAVFGSRDAGTGVVSGGLLPDSAVTYISVKNTTPSPWSDPQTWKYVGPDDGTLHDAIPGAGANVLISADSTVIVDGLETARLHGVRVDGTLRFDPHHDTSLAVDTILVTSAGVFQMGTDPTQPDLLSPTGFGERIDANKHAQVTFIDDGAIDLAWDPLQFSRGLVSHGEVSVFGSEVAGFVPLAQNTASFAKSLVLASVPAGWQAGDRLVINGESAPSSDGTSRDEQVEIVGIQQLADGRAAVQITAPEIASWKGLKYPHSAALTYVADVTRNAVFQSENPGVVARRGHVMFMHNHDVQIDAAGFYGLGRTDKRNAIDDPVLSPDPDRPGSMTTDVIDVKTQQRVMVPVVDANGDPVVIDGVKQLQVARTGLNPRGRYAVHFHRAPSEDGDTAVIRGSAVVDSPGWGIVNHSSAVDISGNVVFNSLGAGIATETGDETGRIDGNFVMHSTGAKGGGIDSRKNVQDFGQLGDGFWLQGGNVEVTNNVAASNRHAGFVFFAKGLEQAGLGTTRVPVGSLVNPAWAAAGQTSLDVGDVPLRKFAGNTAIAANSGLETWFTLLNISGKNADQQNVVTDFTALNTSNAVFSPYTAHTVIQDSTLANSLSAPWGSAFSGNSQTRDILFDHVHAEGFGNGLFMPAKGVNEVRGGYYNNLKNIIIGNSMDRGRVTTINGNTDASGNLDPSQPLFGTLDDSALKGRQQLDIGLSNSADLVGRDITRLFNPDVIQFGEIHFNDHQLYFKQQAADFIVFDPAAPGGVPDFVPAELIGLTNRQLFDRYGIALAGAVAPANATTSPRIDALIGEKTTYLPDLVLTSGKWVNQDNGPYKLAYLYYDPSDPKANAKGWVQVRETTPTLLANGWNVIRREVLGHVRTLFVFGDNLAPEFVLSDKSVTTINLADLHNGSGLTISGHIIDNSFGKQAFSKTIRLDDATAVSALQSDAAGSFVMVSFTIRDLAGNTSKIQVRINVLSDVILIKDIGRKNLPTIGVSVTLQGLQNKQVPPLKQTP